MSSEDTEEDTNKPKGTRIAYAIRGHIDASHASSRGTFFPTLDYSNWREKIKDQRAIKLDDAAKQRYIETLAQTGKRGLAAAAAGVTGSTIQKHMKADPDFIEACEQAIDDYREQRVLMIENQALAGFEETIFSPTGEMATRQRYETQLRIMVLKAYDKETYTERKEIDVTFKGGAIVIPLPPSADDWDSMFEGHGKKMGDLIAEGETVPVDIPELPTAESRLRASGHAQDINGNKRPSDE